MNANEVIATLAGRAAGRTCTRTTTSTRRSRPTTSSRPRSTSPPPRPLVHRRRCPRWSTSPPRCAAAKPDWADVVKAGRTHLMDAVPITLGQEAGGWATQVRVRRRAGARRAAPARRSCPSAARRSAPGSTRPHGFGAAVVERLRAATGLDVLTEAPRPHRGAGLPRRPRGGLRRAAHGRGVALQDRQRHPLAELGARAPASPSCSSPTCSPAARSCRARSTR